MSVSQDDPHFPGRAPIDGYGQGGFRFAGMSHRGSLLIVPSGIYAWPVATAADLSEDALARVFTEAGQIDLLMIGSGRDPIALPATLRERCKAAEISVDIQPTGGAASTYNVLLDEGRRVAAALIAVG
ncbi:MAG TPA: MTH938/NDUFAF3 family protein [Xanthobacteraceae bacterium]|nr:MTH938/NDUFAF3 family protein [Xanthobacteraceae bacterium]